MAEVELAWTEDDPSHTRPSTAAALRGHPVVMLACGAFVGLVVGLFVQSTGAPSNPAVAPSTVSVMPGDYAAPLPGVRDFRAGSPGIVAAAPSLSMSPSEPRSDCYALTFADPGVSRAAVTAHSNCSTNDVGTACAGSAQSGESSAACGDSGAATSSNRVAAGSSLTTPLQYGAPPPMSREGPDGDPSRRAAPHPG